jgi:hypothetical protein
MKCATKVLYSKNGSRVVVNEEMIPAYLGNGYSTRKPTSGKTKLNAADKRKAEAAQAAAEVAAEDERR